MLSQKTAIAQGPIMALVEKGWVSLSGELDYDFQSVAVERMIHRLKALPLPAAASDAVEGARSPLELLDKTSPGNSGSPAPRPDSVSTSYSNLA